MKWQAKVNKYEYFIYIGGNRQMIGDITQAIEVVAWYFVKKQWSILKKSPTLDQGFENSFRNYLYQQMKFDIYSDVADTGLGLSYTTFSDNRHELDVICVKEKNLFVIELKHYEVSNITKEIVFTFIGKVMDFYFKNANILSDYNITLLLVTINKNIDDSIRKICITYGVKLIEPSYPTFKVLDHFLRDFYSRNNINGSLKNEIENIIEDINALRKFDYSLSDIINYKEDNFILSFPMEIKPTNILSKFKECYNKFEEARKRWKKS